MDIPSVGPHELELNALGLMPAHIQFEHQDVLDLDYLFKYFGEGRDLSQGLRILNSIPYSGTINGVVHPDCKVRYMKDDCAVIEYGDTDIPGRLNVLVVRQDPKEIVRPIQLLPDYPLAGSVNGFDIVDKFRAADDLLQAVENIVNNT